MSMDWFQDVKDFHQKFNCYIGERPAVPSKGTPQLRKNIIKEEYEELIEAMERGDLPEIADAICDLTYVILGTAVSYGMDVRPVWDAVQKTNMAKVGGGEREDGKILKPDGWTPPPVKELIEAQMH